MSRRSVAAATLFPQDAEPVVQISHGPWNLKANNCTAAISPDWSDEGGLHVNVIPDAPFLVIPKVSSERREYVPVGWLEPPTIPSDLVFVLGRDVDGFRAADLGDAHGVAPVHAV